MQLEISWRSFSWHKLTQTYQIGKTNSNNIISWQLIQAFSFEISILYLKCFFRHGLSLPQSRINQNRSPTLIHWRNERIILHWKVSVQTLCSAILWKTFTFLIVHSKSVSLVAAVNSQHTWNWDSSSELLIKWPYWAWHFADEVGPFWQCKEPLTILFTNSFQVIFLIDVLVC